MQRKKAENTHGVDFVDFVDLSFGPGAGRGLSQQQSMLSAIDASLYGGHQQENLAQLKIETRLKQLQDFCQSKGRKWQKGHMA